MISPISTFLLGKVNLVLERLFISDIRSHIVLIAVDTICRWAYTRHGLHINRKGKGKPSGLIAG